MDKENKKIKKTTNKVVEKPKCNIFDYAEKMKEYDVKKSEIKTH